jgi:hypothetical protein
MNALKNYFSVKKFGIIIALVILLYQSIDLTLNYCRYETVIELRQEL